MTTCDPHHVCYRGHAALRRGRTSIAGQVYLATVATMDRRPHFHDFEIGARVSQVLSERRVWRGGRLLAWVLMPDHWHGLIELGSMDSLSTVVGRMKALTSRVATSSMLQATRVWAPAFHDHAMRKDQDIIAAARYVIANPLRAGLVERVGDYPFWDAVWL